MKMASRVVEAKLITKSLVMNTMELGLKASFMGLVSIQRQINSLSSGVLTEKEGNLFVNEYKSGSQHGLCTNYFEE